MKNILYFHQKWSISPILSKIPFSYHSDTVKSADDTEVAIRDCPTMSVGSDLRLLYKYGNTETGLLSKRRSDPTKNVGQSITATCLSSDDSTVTLCRRGQFTTTL